MARDSVSIRQRAWTVNRHRLTANLLECAYARLRSWRIELSNERELRRIVNAALSQFFHDLHGRVASRLSDTVQESNSCTSRKPNPSHSLKN